MKKVNRYRNNNNSIYSLNYKFDSNSIAGKISGTALDLIRRYNDMAKDAHSNNDYVTAEIFRQYAEHYRKIVTEINERKSPRDQMENNANDNSNSSNNITAENVENNTIENQPENNAEFAETQSVVNEVAAPAQPAEEKAPKKRAFHVVEISSPAQTAAEDQPRRHRTTKNKAVAEG
ncbi:MAG: DUF4167 domain-containing protein [Alphaproteobacteria bacterium]|nr:DUF4167 domain-containing protein [Alphaproteobacteria bacterium]